MTAVRQSFIFALEGVTSTGQSNFGKGRGYPSSGSSTLNPWIAPPPGSFVSTTASRATTTVFTTGSKFFDTVAYGHYSGAWEWTFNFDYHYLEPLYLAFDNYIYSDGTHTFTQQNNKRVPSFVIRRKILNEMAGGPAGSDEVTDLTGCVVKNISFTRSSGNSQTSITLSGLYVDETMVNGTLDTTDYQEYSGQLAEFMCMFVGDGSAVADPVTLDGGDYVANTDLLGLSMANNAFSVDSTCTPFSVEYGEGKSNFSMNATVYSNNPEVFKTKVYTGGKTVDWSDYARKGPLSKNLAPIPEVHFVAYDTSARDTGTDIITAIGASTQVADFKIEKCVVKSLTWQKGDGSKLQDQLSSVESRKVTLTVKNDYSYNLKTNPRHVVTSSPDPV